MPTPVQIGFEANGEQSVKKAWETIAKGTEDAIRSLAKLVPESVKADQAQRNLGSTVLGWLKKAESPLEGHLRRLKQIQDARQQGTLDEVDYQRVIGVSIQMMKDEEEAADSLGQAAKRVIADNTTAQTRFNDKLAELKRMREGNKLTEQEYTAAVAKTKREYFATTQAAQTATMTARQGATGAGISLRQMASEVLAVGAAYRMMAQFIGAAQEANRDLSQSMSDTSRNLQEEELKFQIQAGMTPMQVKAQLPAIRDNLVAMPSTTAAGAIQLQTQIKSSGMNAQDADSGALLKEYLEVKAATNQWGKDAIDDKLLVRATNQFLKGLGRANIGSKDVRQLNRQMTNLFENSDLQATHLPALASETASLANFGLDMTDQLAYFAGLVDELEAPEAATGLRNVVTRLSTTENSKEKVEALRKLKLKPEDVAVSKGGRGLREAMTVLDARMKGLNQVDRNLLLNQIFGEQGQSAANLILDPVIAAKIERYKIDQVKGTAFDKGVKSFSESAYASRQRIGIKKDFALREADAKRTGPSFQEVKELGELAVAEAEAKGQRGRAWAQGVGNRVFGIGDSLGLTPEETAQWGSFVTGTQRRSWAGFFTGQAAERQLTPINERKGLGPQQVPVPIAPPGAPPAKDPITDQVVPLLAQIAENGKKPPVVIRKPAGEKPRPVASAAVAAPGGR